MTVETITQATRSPIKSKNILSKVEREEVMPYVSDELLNETP